MTGEQHPTLDRSTGRVWVWWEGREPRLGFTKPLPRHDAVEYMRVLSWKEIEKLASSEGVDTDQYVTLLFERSEAQRREIARLHGLLKKASQCEFGGSYGRCTLQRGHDGNHEVSKDG